MLQKSILMNIKPEFSLLYQFVQLRGLFSIIYLIFGIFCYFLMGGATHKVIDIFTIIAFVVILSPIFITIILLFSCYMNYNATTYKVYDDRIEFEEGFINHKYTTLKWIDIKEIHFTQSFLQRFFGIGHIKFITAANTGNNGYNDGIKFRDIQNPKAIYDKLKNIHNNTKV